MPGMSKNIFDVINNWIRNVESSAVNLVSGIVPWLAPIPAAYMSYQHMVGVLEFPSSVATPVAIVIEALGFATVNTILSFWSYNRKYEDEKRKSPMKLTVFTFGFYLCIVLAINVLIDATAKPVLSPQEIAIIIVRSLLTLMSIPGALVLAVRTQHQEVLNENADAKRERAFKKQYGDKWFEMMYGRPETETFNNLQKVSTSWRTARKTLSQAEVDFIKTATIPDIMRQYNLIERTAYNWQEYARKEN